MPISPSLSSIFAGAALVAAVASCGSTSTPSSAVTQTIGPEGGTIVVDGATVTFPANAVAAPIAITITPTDEPPPAPHVALSKVYRCEPSGTTFAQKVTMAMAFRGDGAGATMFWSSGADVTFKDVGGAASDATMTAEVAHFSAGFVGKKEP
jgi:hypothetical protein